MEQILVLRSDFYSKLNANNTQSDFTINFDNPLDFTDGYNCGLVEVIFPTKFKNIPQEMTARKITIMFGSSQKKFHLKIKFS